MNSAYREAWPDSRIEQLRVPPQSVEAEQAVLGGLMLAPDAFDRIADQLTDNDFYRRDHQLIFRAIRELAERSRPYDAVTLGEWFESQGLAEQVAGGAYLVELASTTPSAANIVAYAEIVRDKRVLRDLISVGTVIVNDGYQPDGRDSSEILADATRAIADLHGSQHKGELVPVGDGLVDWYDDLRQRYERGDAVTGLPYPWHEVNRVTHGLQPGELTIIAGRPSMGKSILGLNVALFNALREVNTAFFSLEMTKRQVNRRCISSLQNIPHDWLLCPSNRVSLDPNDPGRDDSEECWARVTAALRQIKAAPLLVDDSSGIRVEQFKARARRAHRHRKIELLVLDHLHEMAIPGKRDARFEYGEVAAAGKELAKEFDCPAVLLSQLNRSLETRTDKRPVMADLRESGEIEQKADVIFFAYREDYYQRNNPNWEERHDMELILGKGRDLRVGAPIILREDFSFMAARDWDVMKYGEKPSRATHAAVQKGGLK